MPDPRYTPEPRNWCTNCRIHVAHHQLCPVCLDNRGRIHPRTHMASNCRG